MRTTRAPLPSLEPNNPSLSCVTNNPWALRACAPCSFEWRWAAKPLVPSRRRAASRRSITLHLLCLPSRPEHPPSQPYPTAVQVAPGAALLGHSLRCVRLAPAEERRGMGAGESVMVRSFCEGNAGGRLRMSSLLGALPFPRQQRRRRCCGLCACAFELALPQTPSFSQWAQPHVVGPYGRRMSRLIPGCWRLILSLDGRRTMIDQWSVGAWQRGWMLRGCMCVGAWVRGCMRMRMRMRVGRLMCWRVGV